MFHSIIERFLVQQQQQHIQIDQRSAPKMRPIWLRATNNMLLFVAATNKVLSPEQLSS